MNPFSGMLALAQAVTAEARSRRASATPGVKFDVEHPYREPHRAGRIARWLLACGGVASFGLGAVGVVVPGLPTTVFVLLGSYMLTRSCPWIQERLVRLPLFQPYARYVDPSEPVPRHVKRRAVATMWLFIAAAVFLMIARGDVRPWVPAIVVLGGAAGTIVTLRFRRHLE